MFDNAYKLQPNSEDLGTQTFQANVRVGNWKAAQQVCHVLATLYRRFIVTPFRWQHACTNNSKTIVFNSGVLSVLSCRFAIRLGASGILLSRCTQQANEPNTPEALRPILLKLGLRLIISTSAASLVNADRFYVHILLLRELEMYDEALSLIGTQTGQVICETSLVVDELRRDIVRLKGAIKEEGVRASGRILDRGCAYS